MIVQNVRKVITCTILRVLQIALNSTIQSLEYVMNAMKTVKHVLATQQTNVSLVRIITIIMMYQIVVQLARHPTGLMMTTTYVNNVIHTVKIVLVRPQILAQLVNRRTICNLITLLRVLQTVQYHSTQRITPTHVSHVTQPVNNVLVRQ
jgi:hypothetical protein